MLSSGFDNILILNGIVFSVHGEGAWCDFGGHATKAPHEGVSEEIGGQRLWVLKKIPDDLSRVKLPLRVAFGQFAGEIPAQPSMR